MGMNTKEKDFCAAGMPSDRSIYVPLDNHNGLSLRNLFNLVYSRAPLINKATGANFYVSKSLKEELKDNSCTYTVANFRKALANHKDAFGETGVEGLLLTDDRIIFSGFPVTDDLDRLTAFAQLAVLMNNQAIRQRRIQAKTVRMDNERYAMHVWLINLGMIGDEYKTSRRIMMSKLEGSMAFRTARVNQ